jgi:hypothetical protein
MRGPGKPFMYLSLYVPIPLYATNRARITFDPEVSDEQQRKGDAVSDPPL